MKIQLVLILSIIALITIKGEEHVPVFLWGTDSTSTYTPALKTFSSDDFLQLVSSKLNDDTVVIVFTEDDFKTEDITQCKASLGETCFVNIKKIHQKTYLSNVESPVAALKKLSDNRESATVFIDKNGKSSDVEISAGQVVFIEWEDFDSEERNDILAQHDALIAKFISELPEGLNILVVYTGKDASILSRKTRQAKQETESTITSLPVGNQALIYFGRLGYKEAATATEFTNVTFTTGTISDANATFFTVTLLSADAKQVELKFALDTYNYWRITQMTWNTLNLVISNEIAAPIGFSYHCSPLTSFTSANGYPTIQIEGLQIEPSFTVDADFTKFSDSWDCVGFTSGGIWGGLFVTFMMLIILAIGISWIMDINTMDRFDDAKGKTITINAGE